MTQTKLDWALDALRRGLPVFPLTWTDEAGHCSCGNQSCDKPGKHPLPGSHGFKDATRDPAAVREMWGQLPDANIGVYPGRDVVIVDLDLKKGNNGLAELSKKLGVTEFDLLCDTFTARTPTGGYHLYYSADEDFASSVNLLPGVDIRAVGGYVLAPGSVIHGYEDEHYTIEMDLDVAQVREDLKPILHKPRQRDEESEKPLFELDTPAAVNRAKQFLRERSPAVEGMGGNDHTYATVCQLKDCGLSQDAAFQLLLTPIIDSHRGVMSWNDSCRPAWDAAELGQLVKNAYRYGKDRPGAKGGGLIDMLAGEIDFQDASEVSESAEGTPAGGLAAITFRGNALLKRETRREMIIPEWLPAHGFTAFLARRSMGKTVAMVDLALRLVLDMEWHGMPVKEDLSVVYICGEDDVGAQEQIQAWMKKHGVDDIPDRFIFLPGMVDLMNASSVEEWTLHLRKELAGKRAVVFVDTWQRATARGSQNDDTDMQLAVHHAEAMAKSLNGPAVVAFHPPKGDERVVMGSSIIENSTTAIWQMTEHAVGRKLEVTRIKGKGTGNYQLFRFEEIGLDEHDEFGRELSGVVPILVGGTDNSTESAADEGQRAVLANLVRDLEGQRPHSDPPKPKHYSTSEIAEIVTELEERAGERGGDGEPTLEAMAMREHVDDLHAAGIVTLKFRAIRDLLVALFVKNPHGFEFEDGKGVLRTYKDGKAQRFRIEASGL